MIQFKPYTRPWLETEPKLRVKGQLYFWLCTTT